MSFRRELLDHYIYLNENQAVNALIDCVIAGGKLMAPILITGGPGTGKSHLCAALYDMIENQTGTSPIPPKAMIMGGESLGNLLLAARESPCQGNQPLKNKIASPLIIDDLHLFPFSSIKASARLESFLQRHQVVIATSQKPIEELPKDFFKEWGHIRLKEITRVSAEVILRDFSEQYNIRLSVLMVKTLLNLYEAQDLSLGQLKDVLIKGKLKQREGLLITHERSFHTLFKDSGLDHKVQRLILDAILAREQLIRIANTEREGEKTL